MRKIALLLIPVLLPFIQPLGASLLCAESLRPAGFDFATLSAVSYRPPEITVIGENLITDTGLHKGQISGVVRDMDGLAVGGLELNLIKDQMVVSRTTNDTDGSYLFNGIPGGEYILVVRQYPANSYWRIVRHRENSLSIANFSGLLSTAERHTPKWDIAPGSTFIQRPIPVSGAYVAPQPPPYEPEAYVPGIPPSWVSPLQYSFLPLRLDIDTAAYPLLRRHILDGQLPPANSIRPEEIYNYFDYGFPKPEADQDIRITAEVAPLPWNQKRDLLLIGFKARDRISEQRQDSNLVFLVDVSGSMATQQKLPLVKQGLQELLTRIGVKDQMSILAYNRGKALLLATGDGLDKVKLVSAIDKLSAGATDEGEAAFDLAFDLAREHYIWKGINSICYLGDDAFDEGGISRETLDTVADIAEYGISVSAIGFGSGHYNDPNLRELAAAGNGSYAYADNPREVQNAFNALYYNGLVPVIRDLQMGISFNPYKVKAFRYLGFTDGRADAAKGAVTNYPGQDIRASESGTFMFEIIPRDSKEMIPGL
ncbi:MAG TPA: von Willebrand factor type A domain-containing protein, partial [Candidatus Cloacimonadota bacterium]|nr:von Willebrand factor type A domain-containing protein [Candidatus Cloacimonadota bacterium]